MNILIFLSIILCVSATGPVSLDRNPRIVGGENAQIEEFPAIVAIINLSYGMQWCAGSIISDYWVLTAAHCYLNPSQFLLEYGTTNLKITDPGAKHVKPELFIQHEQYDSWRIIFDIGLIKTLEPINTGLHGSISRLAMPFSYYPTGTLSTVAGWGLWSYENNTMPPLQKTDLDIWHHLDCSEAHKASGFNEDILPSNICAAASDFSRAECSGDSGGPLYVNGVQVGIVSWSMKPCTVAQYPGVYTFVGYFLPWIYEKTGIEFEQQNFAIRRNQTRYACPT